ncbi:MAG: helix-turn-helix domain-containing protein [Firmicutes bacterium]|nr:helix-turn-helix domain-containing protein [Bacillota bacterium]
MGEREDRSLRQQTVRRLAAYRMMLRRSQEDLAQELGTSKSSISRIESGRQNVSVDYIEAIARALGQDVSFVMEDHKIEYGDTSQYSLKLYDEELLRFEMVRDIGLPIRILKVNEERREVFPLDLEVSEEGLRRWMEKRTIPRNREGVEAILTSLNLHVTDLKGIIDICMGLSLNDSYWIPQTTFEGTFQEYNLYENRFDSALSLISYVGYGHPIDSLGTTPELTTGGMLRKGWYFSRKKGIWLYKSGTEGFANAGNEPYSEFLAYQVAQRMQLHAVPYELENYHGMLASKCRLFTDIDTSYIPIGRIVRTGGIEACLEYYRQLGEDFYQELASMLVFDAVIVNEDRHFGNFGLLRDNRTGRIISPAPIFDNGISLLCHGIKKEFTDDALFRKYLEERSNPYGYGNQFMDLARRVMGPKQRAQLRRLIGFEFTESDLTNLPQWRVKRLERMIQDRVKELLED